MVRSILLFFTLVFTHTLLAQSSVTGLVMGDGEPLEFATIALESTGKGTSSDASGAFRLEDISSGEHTMVVRSLGYKAKTIQIDIGPDEHLNLGEISLEKDVLGLEEIVVTGTMTNTSIKESPVKVEVLKGSFIESQIAPTSLVDGIKLVNGVQEAVECGICFTNSIRINGLPGPYTAILIDGMPMFGNLASVYGLNGIPPHLIDRFEVIKGPNSTLYGSEAMAGVINVITKDPKYQPSVTFHQMATTHGELFGDVSTAFHKGKVSNLSSFNYGYGRNYHDDNGDGFGDRVNLNRYSLFSKWDVSLSKYKKFSIAAKYYHEDRRNGVQSYLTDNAYREIRGNDSIYGESIYTNRAEVFGSLDIPGGKNLRLDFSYSFHDQNSFYGADLYTAKQHIGFSQLIWNRKFGTHDLLAGGTFRVQHYDDNTIATRDSVSNGQIINRADLQIIPGAFIQDDWQVSEKFSLLTGLRLDYYNRHGLIPAPRIAMKYKPTEWTALRLNLGTGFRVVNLFTEDHAFVTGQREVVINESLNPERSYSATFNLNHVLTIGKSQGVLDVDAFFSFFSNKILPNYDQPGKIIYSNSEGHARTAGLALNWQHRMAFPLSWSIGFNYQRAVSKERNENGDFEIRPIEYSTELSGLVTLNYHWQKADLLFAYTANLNGPTHMPEVFPLDGNGQPLSDPYPLKSPFWSVHNLQITKGFDFIGLEIYTGIRNIFDFVQQTGPLAGYDDPNAAPGFSEYFDTAYAFASQHGREVYFGLRWKLNR